MRHTMRWVLAATMICGVARAATTGPGTTSEKVSAVAPAVPEIPDVRTLRDLKSAPAYTVNGCEVRLGLGSGGSDADGWLILYCLAEPSQKGRVLEPGVEGKPLGPVGYAIVSEGLDRKVLGGRMIDPPTLPALFCATIPLHPKDESVTLWVNGGQIDNSVVVLATRKLPVRKWDPLWLTFATHRDRVAPDTHPAVPRLMDSRAISSEVWAKSPELEDAPLPGSLPTDGRWLAAMGFKDDKDAVGGLTLALKDDKFLVRATGAEISQAAFEHLLARWWVNGKPVSPRQVSMQQRREQPPGLGKEITIAAGVPASIDAKPGDRVTLQVMYSPREWQYAATPGVHAEREKRDIKDRDIPPGVPNVPLLSNKIEFTVTEKMLATTQPTK